MRIPLKKIEINHISLKMLMFLWGKNCKIKISKGKQNIFFIYGKGYIIICFSILFASPKKYGYRNFENIVNVDRGGKMLRSTDFWTKFLDFGWKFDHGLVRNDINLNIRRLQNQILI